MLQGVIRRYRKVRFIDAARCEVAASHPAKSGNCKVRLPPIAPCQVSSVIFHKTDSNAFLTANTSIYSPQSQSNTSPLCLPLHENTPLNPYYEDSLHSKCIATIHVQHSIFPHSSFHSTFSTSARFNSASQYRSVRPWTANTDGDAPTEF